jgi:hypothetical protein
VEAADERYLASKARLVKIQEKADIFVTAYSELTLVSLKR